MSEETKNLPAVQQPAAANVPIVHGQFAPTDLDGLWRLAEIMAGSGMVPEAYNNQPGKVFVAFSWGMEIGLTMNNSLQSIAVIDGKPSIYGDAGLALVRGSGKLEDINEYFEGEFGKDNYTAYCEIKRKDEERVYKFEFSVQDARLMGKWDKATRQGYPSVWQQHPKRMLKWRARWFALRDVFGDVLKGMSIFEEIQDSIEMEPDASGQYVQQDVTPAAKPQDSPPCPEDDTIVDAEFEDEKPEPTAADYVNPDMEGETAADIQKAEAATETVDTSTPDEVVSLAGQFYQIIGIENKEAGDAFVEKAMEINGCDADKIYVDAIAKPDVFKGLVDKWIASTVKDKPVKAPVVVDDVMSPVDEMIQMAGAYYGEEVKGNPKELLISYVDYIVEVAGHSPAQILANLKSSPGEWFGYYEGWTKQQVEKTKESAPEAVTETPSEAPESTISKEAAADMQSALIKPGEVSWPAWKLKWNTMKPQDFEGAVWSQLDKFASAETEAPAISKRARAKWADFYPDKVYPVDAKKEEVANSAGPETTDDVDTRWAFIHENYPESVTKALDKRKMAKNGLGQQAKAIIIQDVYEMNS